MTVLYLDVDIKFSPVISLARWILSNFGTWGLALYREHWRVCGHATHHGLLRYGIVYFVPSLSLWPRLQAVSKYLQLFNMSSVLRFTSTTCVGGNYAT